MTRYEFLPADQREDFPRRFARCLRSQLFGHYRKEGPPWHMLFAQASEEEAVRRLRWRFDGARRGAARRAGRYDGREIDFERLDEIISDADIFASLGLGPRAEMQLDEFRPLSTHPLGALDLGDEWFARTGMSAQASIQEARAEVTDAELADELGEAVGRHRVRLRWVALVRRARADEEWPPAGQKLDLKGRLELPDYEELMWVAQALFCPVVVGRPIADLVDEDDWRAEPILEACREAGVERIGDLPWFRSDLRKLEEAAGASFRGVVAELRRALFEWGADLERERPASSDKEAAARGLKEGLDELEAIFK